MGIITEKKESESIEKAFCALMEYKFRFFEDFAELERIVGEARKAPLGMDTLEQWVEISSRLEIMAMQTRMKIVRKLAGD